MYIQSTITREVFEVWHSPDPEIMEFTVRNVTTDAFQNIPQGVYISMLASGLYVPYEHEKIIFGSVDKHGKVEYLHTSSDTLLN